MYNDAIQQAVNASLLDAMPQGIYIKDKDLVFRYGNHLAVEPSGLKADDYVGRSDWEMPWDKHAQSYIDYDNDTLAGHHYSKLSLSNGTDGEKIVIHDRKFVLSGLNGEQLGVIGTFKIIPFKYFEVFKVINGLTQDSYKICADLNNYLNSTKENYTLTKKESTCLFYTLHGKSAKEIARVMGISNKTVEFHIANIKIKWNCNTKQDLFVKAFELGCFNVLPLHILQEL
ncbi:MAG: hypothetical protein CMF50_02640 [Legionellales bacterium]|nr:hypothetical protein [Legionellales bacterium]|tara:strand:+ start:1877 stop:2563 length:687 start_codon:yes stop_codon:yes gene_type:complete